VRLIRLKEGEKLVGIEQVDEPEETSHLDSEELSAEGNNTQNDDNEAR
jgi:hypothetical protein